MNPVVLPRRVFQYLEIEKEIEKAMNQHQLIEKPSLEQIIQIGEEIIGS